MWPSVYVAIATNYSCLLAHDTHSEWEPTAPTRTGTQSADYARTQTREKLGKKMVILGRKNSQGPRCENLDDVFLLFQ